MSLILPRLYLGSAIEHAYDDDFLKDKRITHVLNCAIELPIRYPKHIIINHIKMNDNDDNSAEHIFKGADIINETLKNSSSNLLVHCMAGRSRSVSVVLAYLVKYKNYSPDKALEYVKSCRDCVKPYNGFLTHIKNNYSYQRIRRYFILYQ